MDQQNKCPECGGKLVYQYGVFVCSSCRKKLLNTGIENADATYEMNREKEKKEAAFQEYRAERDLIELDKNLDHKISKGELSTFSSQLVNLKKRYSSTAAIDPIVKCKEMELKTEGFQKHDKSVDAEMGSLLVAFQNAKPTFIFANDEFLFSVYREKIEAFVKNKKKETELIVSNAKKRKKLIFGLIGAVLLLIISVGIFFPSEEQRKTIRVPISAEEVKDKQYTDVETLFRTAGFSNIEIENMEDVKLGWFVTEGEVETVSINGNTTFSSFAKFPEDAKVVITYHGKKEK